MRPALNAIAPALLALWLPAAAALAQPQTYALQPEASHVVFLADLAGQPLRGEIPLGAADLRLDFTDLAASSVAVVLQTGAARADLPLMRAALLGDGVLDGAHFPQARFVSTRVRPVPGGAVVEGLLTLKGITQPVALQATLLRQRGTAPGDLDRLTLHLQGAISRSQFGADAMPDLVGDRVGLDITLRIRRVD